MKIAILTSRYPSQEQPYNHMFVHTRARNLQKNCSVTVFVPSNQSENYVYEGITVVKTSNKKIIDLAADADLLYLHLLNIYPFSKESGLPIYQYIIKKNLPHAIYIHGSEVQKYGQYGFDFDFSIRQITKFFFKDFFVIPHMRLFFKKTNKRRNNLVLFPSKWMKSTAEKSLNIKFDNYRIIPNGIDTDFFDLRQELAINPRRMVSIRSFSSEVYDIKKTIELMSLLPDDYTLDIYGEGKLILKYKKLIVKMNLKKRVKIIPKFLDHENMKKTFRSYDLFISTTRFDSQGVTMLEAVSSGLLLVTINNSSREEFIEDGVTGLLANNVYELSNKIVEITNNNALFQKVVLQGSSKMKDLSTNCISEKEIDALKNVIL